jgi:hypothetical protein
MASGKIVNKYSQICRLKVSNMASVTEINSKLREIKNKREIHSPEEISDGLSAILVDLMTACADIAGAMISSTDGHAQAQKLDGELDYNRFAAMSSALLALSDTLISETQQGDTKNILLESESGNIFIMHAGNQLLLTVFTKPSSNLGMSLAYARKAAEEILHMDIEIS